MTRIFWGQKPYLGNRAAPRKEEEEFGPGKDNVIICTECSAVYFYKSWHHTLQEYKYLSPKKSVHFALCPADQMKKSGTFEGQVILHDVPKEVHNEILAELEHIGSRAYARDPMDRILYVHSTDGSIEVRTSENQLALSIARQIHKAHKSSQLEMKTSEEESIARAKVWWPTT